MPFPSEYTPAIQPDLIHVGRADLWTGVTLPAGVGNFVALVSGKPATGTYVGATLAATILNYNPGIFDIVTQQNTGVVGTVLTSEIFNMDITLGELTYANLKAFMLGAADATTFVTVGGIIVPTLLSVLLVAPRRAGNYITAMIYQAAMIDNRAFSFDRTGQLVHKVMARGQAVVARVLGDQLGYFNPNQVSS